jgi:hypothetical protein
LQRTVLTKGYGDCPSASYLDISVPIKNLIDPTKQPCRTILSSHLADKANALARLDNFRLVLDQT